MAAEYGVEWHSCGVDRPLSVRLWSAVSRSRTAEVAEMNEEHIANARKRVRRLRDFYVHFAIYVVVISGVAVLGWFVSPTFWWVAFPAVGWGIGLTAHAVSVFFEDSFLGAVWEERKTREFLGRE
jgi:hypothetical protein